MMMMKKKKKKNGDGQSAALRPIDTGTGGEKKQNKRRTISYRVFLLFLFPTEFSFFFLSYQTKKNQREICSASIEKRDDIFYFVVHLTFLWCVGG